MPTTAAAATGGVNLLRYTQRVIAGLKTKTYRELPFAAGLIVPFRNDLSLADTEIVEHYAEGRGRARLLSEVANDIPLVDYSIGEDTYKVATIVDGYFINYQELARANNVLGKIGAGTLQNTLADVGARAIMEFCNDWTAFGLAARGIKGFFNKDRVLVDDNAFDPYDNTQTFQSHINFVERSIFRPFRELHRLNTRDFYIAVPDSLLGVWMTTHAEDGKTTVYEQLMKIGKPRGLGGIMALNECRRADAVDPQQGNLPANIGTPGKDRIVTWVKRPDVLAFDGSGLLQWPEVRKETGYTVPMYKTIGEMILSKTTSMLYTDIVTEPAL